MNADRALAVLAVPLLALSLAAPAAAKPRPIGWVQGTGAASAHVGQRVMVEGVVMGGSVADLGGIFIQDLRGDGDPRSSEGLYLKLDPGQPAPAQFDRVRVSGTVAELGKPPASLTSLVDVRIDVLGPLRLPEPPAMAMPADGDWEPYEGMAVRLSGPLTVSGVEGLSRYGEIVVSAGGRLFAPTEVAAPGPAAATVEQANARRRFILDDGITRPLDADPWFLGPGERAGLRAGSRIREAIGIVDQRRGEYRLQLTGSLAGQVELAPRPPAPEVAGDLRVASLNVLNLFNGDGRGGGFPTPRGAETRAQYQRQQLKLVASVQALAPDIAALMEIENDGYGPDSALAQFVAALNAAGPIRDYRYVDAGKGPGTNPIRVALIYRQTRVQPVGKPAVLEGGPFEERSRVPLAQAFRRGDGPALVVVANHLKSKGCGRGEDEATGADADQHDGQSCWNAVRLESVRRIDAWLRGDPTGSGSDLRLLLGDFNAYAQEDPLRWLREAGWRDAFADTRQPYSFVYQGLAGRLDHALLSPALAPRLRGAAEWHNNCDEPESGDYHRDGASGPYRASDHDPYVLGFDLGR